MMGFIRYAGIQIDIKKTREISRVQINSPDGVQYLYTKWTFDIIGYINPQALSYSLAGATPVVTLGLAPVDTDNAIRQALRTHRQKLSYIVGDRALVVSPAVGAQVDSNQGPIVEVCDIQEIIGTQTFVVHFRVVTYINDCGITIQKGRVAGGQDDGIATHTGGAPLLSNRWTMSEEVDEHHMSMVTTRGVAIFDTARMRLIGGTFVWPDQYRHELIPRPHVGFKRTVSVEIDSDGTTAYYTAHDRQLNTGVASNVNLTRVECHTTAFVSRASVLHALTPSAPRLAISAFRGGVSAVAMGIVAAAATAVPHYNFNCLVRVWGNTRSHKANLAYLAVGTAILRVLEAADGNSSVELIVTMDDMGRFVECSFTTRTGMERAFELVGGRTIQSIMKVTEFIAGTAPTSIAGLASHLRRGDDWRVSYSHALRDFDAGAIGDLRASFGTPGAVLGDELNSPYSNGTRGTALVRLVHQLIPMVACPNPCDPQNISPIDERKMCADVPAVPASEVILGEVTP